MTPDREAERLASTAHLSVDDGRVVWTTRRPAMLRGRSKGFFGIARASAWYAPPMVQLWIAAALLTGVTVALVAWAIRDRQRRVRASLGLGFALIATVGLGFVIYAMIVFCEAPPGSACM